MLDEHLEHLAQRRARGSSFAGISGFLLETPKLDERGLAVSAVCVDLLAYSALVDVAVPDPPSSRQPTLLPRHVPSVTDATAVVSQLEWRERHSRAGQPQYSRTLTVLRALRVAEVRPA